MADMEVVCLQRPAEYIELDLSAMNLNDTLYLTDIKVPSAVTISALAHGANPRSSRSMRRALPSLSLLRRPRPPPLRVRCTAVPRHPAGLPRPPRRKRAKDAGKDARRKACKSNRAPAVGCSVCCGGYP